MNEGIDRNLIIWEADNMHRDIILIASGSVIF